VKTSKGLVYLGAVLLACVCPLLPGGNEQDIRLFVSMNHESDLNPDPLFPEFTGDVSDMGFTLDAEYTFTVRPSKRNTVGFLVGGAMTSRLSESDYDVQSVDASFFYRRDDMGPFTFFACYRYEHYTVGGDAYVYTNTFTPMLAWKQSEALTGIFSFRMAGFGYHTADFLDGYDFSFTYKQVWFVNASSELAASLSVNDASLDADPYSYFGVAAAVEYTWFLRKNWRVHGALSADTRSFAADFPGEGEARKETGLRASAGTDYDFGRWGKVFAGVTYFNNMSNVSVFEMDRMAISAGYIYTISF